MVDVRSLVSEVSRHVLGLDAEPQMSSHLWMEIPHDALGERDLPLLFLLQRFGVRDACRLVVPFWHMEDLKPAIGAAQVAASFWEACFQMGEELTTLLSRGNDFCQWFVDAPKAFFFFGQGRSDWCRFFVRLGER